MKARFFPPWIVLTLALCVSAALAQPRSVPKGKTEGISPALLAKAKSGDAEAQYQVGNAYNFGDKVRQDYAQAFIWYRKSAEQGSADSQFRLGGLYHLGHGVPQDDGEAFNWIIKAAHQGHIDAEFYISTCYDAGWGVTPNYAKEVIWLRRAAEQGDARSQFYLGHFYDAGRGVPRDYAKAYFWFAVAASGDATDSDRKQSAYRRDLVAPLLTPEELSREQANVRNWLKDHPVQSQ